MQFGLLADPLDYLGLDYLDPIFQELKPPLLTNLPYWNLMDKHVLEKSRIEFQTLAGIDFVPNLVASMRQEIGGITTNYILKRIDDYQRDYVVLKACGYEEITDKMADALVSDFSEAIRLFMIYGNFLSEPSLCSRKTIINRTLENVQEALKESPIKQAKISLPCEIGRFLIRKTSLFPESFQACLDVISKYKQEELERVLCALNEAICSGNLDLANAKSEDVSAIFENVWSDAKELAKSALILRYGIPIDLAAIGVTIGLAGGVLAAATGFLAGLGFGIAQETVKVGIEPLSEKIARFGEPSYVTTIFDFQKKIKLKA